MNKLAPCSVSNLTWYGAPPSFLPRMLLISLGPLEVEVTDGEVTPAVLSFSTVVVTTAALTLWLARATVYLVAMSKVPRTRLTKFT
jgi:hypothetical protein